MTKTVTLSGAEVKIENLGGQNTMIKNLGDNAVYASPRPGIAPDADNVIEIAGGAGEVLYDTRGTVYLKGTGRVQLTGQDYSTPNFMQTSVLIGGDGGNMDLAKAYIDQKDAETLAAAKRYSDTAVEGIEIPTIPASLPANGGNAATVGGHTVGCDVPANAVFTDTKYTAASAAPKAPGTAAVGTSAKYAREDHVHPAQTSVSGNAGTATKLATARKINGVNFDGSADITVEDNTKLPTSGGTITGLLIDSGIHHTSYIDTLTSPAQLTHNGYWSIYNISEVVNSNIAQGATAFPYQIGDYTGYLLSNTLSTVDGCRYGTLIVTSPRFGGDFFLGRIWEFKFVQWTHFIGQ